MNDLTVMVLLSLLTGFVAAGFVWFGWDLAARLRTLAANYRHRRKLSRDADALLAQSQRGGGENAKD